MFGQYRGKDIHSGEWVTGFYKYHPYYDIHLIYYFELAEYLPSGGYWSEYEVDPKTLGACIPLTDNNGIQRYQHDILKEPEDGGLFYIDWDYDKHCWSVYAKTKKGNIYSIIDLAEALEDGYTFTGENIHDNPKLEKIK